MIEGGTLWDLVERRAEDTPDALMAIDEDGRTVTFAGFRADAERAAAGLAAQGVAEGDVVSWQLPTWLESQTLVAALARLGAVQNPILPIYRSREVGFVTGQAGSSLLVVPSEWRGFDFEEMARSIAADQSGLEVLVADRMLPQGDPSTLPPPPAAADEPDDFPVRWLFYTSGTTADPKGARHTDGTLGIMAKGMGERLRLQPEDRSAMVFPFTHIGGIGWLFCCLQFGTVSIFIEAFDPESTVEVLRREGVTLAGAGTPFHMAYLAAQRSQPGEPLFPEVRAFPGGGAPKPPQLHYDLKKEMGGVGIVAGWGLTEAPILTMADVNDDDEELANTEGKALPGVDLRVVTLAGEVAGPGEEGEFRAKAPQLMRGYLDSSLDADAFDDDGYFRTGDLGFLDERGNAVITGRVKDVIIRKGENISAKEVEDLLFQHPKVQDVAVIGLPDPELGERCCAVVSTPEGSEALGFDEMVEFLKAEGLMIQKVPEQLEHVDVVPRNPSGKIQKHQLRDRYAA